MGACTGKPQSKHKDPFAPRENDTSKNDETNPQKQIAITQPISIPQDQIPNQEQHQQIQQQYQHQAQQQEQQQQQQQEYQQQQQQQYEQQQQQYQQQQNQLQQKQQYIPQQENYEIKQKEKYQKQPIEYAVMNNKDEDELSYDERIEKAQREISSTIIMKGNFMRDKMQYAGQYYTFKQVKYPHGQGVATYPDKILSGLFQHGEYSQIQS